MSGQKVRAVIRRSLKKGNAVYHPGQRLTLEDSPVVAIFEREGIISVERESDTPAPAVMPVEPIEDAVRMPVRTKG